jgi:AcrR family transcriptional regulator
VTASLETTRRKSARKPKGDGHLRRGEILDAAERIFVVEGYEGATIRKIADEVGVSSTALYMHFSDKAAILGEICNRTLAQLLERNRQLTDRASDPVLRVRAVLAAYMRWGFEHPNAYQLVYSTPRPVSAGHWPEDTVDLSYQCYELFADLVRKIAAEGRLRAGAPDSVAQVLWMACHGVVGLSCARPTFNWVSQDELIEVTLEGLLRGLFVD